MLASAENAPPVDAVQAVTGELVAALGARSVSFLVSDLSGDALVRLARAGESGAPATGGRRRGEEVATVLPFDRGPRERVVRTQKTAVVAEDGGWTVLAPVTERGDVIGLLEFALAEEPDRSVLEVIARTAHTLAFVVIANRQHTDLFEWGQRTAPLTLSAEIQRRLLPGSFTCEDNVFTLSGWLEPASSIGGDTFDYTVARDVLYFSVTDAMGHGVGSALTATLAVSSLRNARRRGERLKGQAAAANAALAAHRTVPGGYVTAVLGRLDLRTGVCGVINAGHVAPLLIRQGRIGSVKLPRNFPLGLFAEPYRVGVLALRPGDRLAVFTDGMLERNVPDLDLQALLEASAGLHPREAARRLTGAVLEQCGRDLNDDATMLIIDWHGGEDRRRQAAHGADRERASAAATG